MAIDSESRRDGKLHEWKIKILDRIKVVDDCWVWQGRKDGKGYGVVYVGHYQHMRAHRVSYRVYKGEIPEGLELDHICENRLCVNPHHLEPVTHAENSQRSSKMAKLTAADVAVIRSLHEPHTVTAKRYGLHPSTVCDIRLGNRWAM